jgi:hypothetical protein
MIPVKNMIPLKGGIKLMGIEAHYCQVDGGGYSVTQHLFDPPIQINNGESATITWTIATTN